MKTATVSKLFAVLVILALGTLTPTLAQNSEAQFQQGLIKEEGEGSLLEAIEIYDAVAKNESAGRSLQAEALLHIGLCYEKLGRTEAEKTYQNLISNFPDQTETVKIARKKLSLLSQSANVRYEETREFNIRKVWEGPRDLLGEVSPDGKYLSYVDWDTGDLAIYELSTGKTRRLTDKGSWDDCQEYAEDSRWSNDGKHIVYTWWNDKEIYELRMIGLDGSAAKVLYSNEEVNYMVPSDWSPDGSQILACMYFQENRIQAAGLINVADGSMRVLKTLEDWPGKMCFSKDGSSIIYDHQQKENSSVRDIYMLPLDGSNEIPLVKNPADDFFLGLAPDGESILFSSDRDGTISFYMIQIEDGKSNGDPKLVKSGVGQIDVLGFTPEGSFYYHIEQNLNDIYTAELDPESGSIISPLAKMVTRFLGNNKEPDYSPNGKQLAYISVIQPSASNINFNQGAGNVLIIRSIDTYQERKIIPDLPRMGFPRWSPDGKSIMVGAWDENSSMSFHQIDAETGQMKTILSSDKVIRFFGRHEWSPDGSTLYYGLLTNNFRNSQIMSRDLESGEVKMIYESKDILNLSLSPDGHWLAIISRSKSAPNWAMHVMPASGGEARELFRFKEGEFSIGLSCSCTWSIDGNYILFMLQNEISEDSQWELCRIPAKGGEIEKLGITIPGGTANLAIHPDGRHISFSALSRPLEPAVWVMENFLPSD
ncbi:MAG: tetratricopeptide repeat protein [Bacteroidia bacterium]|nr:MAG: tetratricopeptide repeat protein [Bacteroidia bacterium]